MRNLIISFPMALMTVAALTGAATGHHGWGSYDASRRFTIAAPVEMVSWTNPHAHIMVKHEGATWEATLAPLFRMEARGLSAEMLKPGTMVIVEGYPSTRNAHEMR